MVNDGEITDLERSLLEETWLMDVVTLIGAGSDHGRAP